MDVKSLNLPWRIKSGEYLNEPEDYIVVNNKDEYVGKFRDSNIAQTIIKLIGEKFDNENLYGG